MLIEDVDSNKVVVLLLVEVGGQFLLIAQTWSIPNSRFWQRKPMIDAWQASNNLITKMSQEMK